MQRARSTVHTATEVPAAAPLAGTNGIIAEVFRRGGSISRLELKALVQAHGYDPRTVGILHGRRLAHLHRKAGTDISVLTARGEEVARQYLFSARLAEGAKAPDERSAAEINDDHERTEQPGIR